MERNTSITSRLRPLLTISVLAANKATVEVQSQSLTTLAVVTADLALAGFTIISQAANLRFEATVTASSRAEFALALNEIRRRYRAQTFYYALAPRTDSLAA